MHNLNEEKSKKTPEAKRLRVALINNINNNFFALARFLRDKEIDAHLFQIDDLDGHFDPQCDTFEDEAHCDYFHKLASITFRDFFKLPLSLNRFKLKKFKNILNDFDVVIATGGLATLEWAGINVDIFIPHGGDLYQSPFMFDFCVKKHFPYSVLMKKYIKYQRRSIAKARAVTTVAGLSRQWEDALVRLKKNWINWTIPMVYPLPDVHTGRWNFLNEYDFIAFSHTRQGWKTAVDYKGNDRFIRAFARFVKSQKYFKNPVMVLFEYGPDVIHSKDLIHALRIDSYVRWVPAMQRKFIYEGLKKSSIVFDFIHNDYVTMGGVSFEAFCCSKPVIGSTRVKGFEVTHSVPLVHASSEEDVFNVFMDYGLQPEKYIEMGKQAKEWFDENVGVGLVDKYIGLIRYLASNKSASLNDHSGPAEIDWNLFTKTTKKHTDSKSLNGNTLP